MLQNVVIYHGAVSLMESEGKKLACRNVAQRQGGPGSAGCWETRESDEKSPFRANRAICLNSQFILGRFLLVLLAMSWCRN